MVQRTRPVRAAAGRRRGPRKGDLKEAAILDTAWTLLTTKPISQITIEDLASGAGLSRSAFYFYFESKESVMLALSTRVADEIRDATAVFFEVREGGATIENLRASIAGYLARWREKGSALRAMATLAESDGSLQDFWSRVSGDLLDAAATSLETQQNAGLALPSPPASHDLVRVLFAMMWRTGYELSLQPATTHAEEERLVETLTAVIVRACYGDAYLRA